MELIVPLNITLNKDDLEALELNTPELTKESASEKIRELINKEKAVGLREYDFDTWCCPTCQIVPMHNEFGEQTERCMHCGQKLIVPWVHEKW